MRASEGESRAGEAESVQVKVSAFSEAECVQVKLSARK